ncbi:MAG TPA: alpha/beta fold hydrolase [Planctomycetaceae bacterium]|nr:alpha/beta fold hydrolase [Planctomycetaceae bacterium]
MTCASETAPPPDRSGFQDEYPFRSHFLPIDGHRYHYVDEGDGPPLLMVHGNPTWSFAWRNLIRRLGQGYRVLAVDHLGMGFSDKPQVYSYDLAHHIANLQTFLEQLDLTRVTLIAHDWGGAIGLGAALRSPDRFARFVLMNTAAFPSKRIPWRIAVCRTPVLGALAVRGLNAFARAALRQAVAKPEQITASIRRGYLAPYDSWRNRIAILRFVQDIPMSKRHPSYATLAEIEQGLSRFRRHPVLLIWGERDWCFTRHFLEEFQRHWPQAETVTLPEAGHYVFEDARERIAAEVGRFLRQTSPRDNSL